MNAKEGVKKKQLDLLASWNDGEAKRSIIEFVEAVTDQKGPDYVPAADRIAVFDNDGTLWCEQPLYIQLAFALERVKALVTEHPEWRAKQPFKAVLEGDLQALGAAGAKGLLEIVAATHSGMTTDEFEGIARDWFATAQHQRFGRPTRTSLTCPRWRADDRSPVGARLLQRQRGQAGHDPEVHRPATDRRFRQHRR